MRPTRNTTGQLGVIVCYRFGAVAEQDIFGYLLHRRCTHTVTCQGSISVPGRDLVRNLSGVTLSLSRTSRCVNIMIPPARTVIDVIFSFKALQKSLFVDLLSFVS